MATEARGDIKTLPRDAATVVDYGAHLEPALVVKPGETFVVETNDNWWNQIAQAGDVPDRSAPPVAARQYLRCNPLAGPIFVEGVEAGDTLVVKIEEIAVRDWGWTGTVEGIGPLAGLRDWADIDVPFATIIRHEPGPSGTLDDGEAVMRLEREVRWPLAPFIGTIATAPERGIETAVIGQGPWGGNIDVRHVSAGNELHLNATHAGGLLFLGDVHASQGDSELTGQANETAAAVKLTCSVIPGKQVPGVCRIETASSVIQVDSARNAGSVERAMNSCFLNLMRWLVDDFGLSPREAYLQMGANSLVRMHVYQFTSGFFTCGVEFPKTPPRGIA
jgi:acetamidase/formamidase